MLSEETISLTALFYCCFVLPTNNIVITGLSRQKKAKGRYESTGTPSTSAINTPHTLHGTSGLITVPASSKVLERAFLDNPAFSYISLYVSPVSRMDKYCSPITTLMPIDVAAAEVAMERTFLSFSCK